MKTETLQTRVKSLLALIESMFTKSELYGDCPPPVQSLYLELRKTAYQLRNAPECFSRRNNV